MTHVQIRLMRQDEVKAVCSLVMDVFMEFIAPLHDASGIAGFSNYANPASMTARQNHHFVLVAEVDRRIVGVVEMRDYRHLALLFVAADYQGQGISRQLWDAARAICLEKHPHIDAFTVNAAPNSLAVYEHFGFVATDREQFSNGIRFTPMRVEIKQ